MKYLFYALLCLLLTTAHVQAQTEADVQKAGEALKKAAQSEYKQLNRQLMELYKEGRIEEAIPIAKAALIATEKEFGKQHSNYATSLNNLALLYKSMGKYAQAEPLLQQALQIDKATLGENHPDYANSLNNLAGLYKNMGEYAQAEPLLQQALQIRKTALGENHPDYATSLNNLAGLYQSIGKYAQAEPLYQQALQIRKTALGENHPAYATSLNNLAVLYQSMGKYAQAEPFYQQAMQINKATLGESHPNYAASLNNLAGLYRSMGEYAQAEPLYQQALQIRKAALGENHPDYATSLNNLALLYQSMGKYAQAEPLYQQALQISKAVLGEKHPDYAASLNTLAVLYQRMGKYAQAEPLYQEALQINKATLGENHPYYAIYLNHLAGLYQSTGKYAQAEPLYQQALQISKATLGENHPYYATYLNNLAGLYYTEGKYAQAEPLYQQALQIRKAALGENHPDYALSLLALANLYQSMGKYEQAEPLLQQALQINKATLGENHPSYATALNNLALLYKNMGEYAQAEPLYQQAMQIRKAALGENHTDYAASLNNLALLYQSMGKYAQAESLYQQSLQIDKAALGENHPSYATSLNNLANLYQNMGKYAQAEPLYQQAMQIQKAALGENNPDYANYLNNLASLYESMGKYAQAEPLLQQAQDIRIRQLESTFPSLSEKEKEQFLATFKNEFEIFHSFALRRGNPALAQRQYNNALLLKGILLQSATQLRSRVLASADTALLATFERWETYKRQWLNTINLTIAERQQRGLDITALENTINELEKDLSRRSDAFAENKRRVTWQDVQKRLQPNQAAVEIVRFSLYDKQWKDTVRYAALVLTPQLKQPQVVVLPHGDLMEARGTQGYRAAVAALRGVGVVTEEESTMPADSLYRLFWQPIQQTLDSLGGCRTVYLSPDGAFHQINLLTLPHPQGGYLADVIDLRIVGSTRDLVQPRKAAPATQPAALFGFPDYAAAPKAAGDDELLAAATASGYATYRALERTGNISPLPGTRTEVANISNIMRQQNIAHQVWQETAASEAQLRSLRSPRVLHIATHGFFEATAEQRPERLSLSGLGGERAFENPYLRCGLYLAGAQHSLQNRAQIPAGTNDGILTAYEAASLRLDGTELVVLSACETGLGVSKNGEGVYGLHRAFQTAGAQAVIYSLWKVADEQTQELMSDFYRRWLVEKKSKRQAFNEAQAALRQKHPAPYFWGAFVLVGE